MLDLEPACFPALREDAETPVGARVARLRRERARELEALLDDGGVAEGLAALHSDKGAADRVRALAATIAERSTVAAKPALSPP